MSLKSLILIKAQNIKRDINITTKAHAQTQLSDDIQ